MRERIKKISKTLMIVTVLVMGIYWGEVTTEAATNNTMKTAQSINMDTQYSDSITKTVDARFYKFTLSQSGRITIDYKAYIETSNYYIYDSNGQEIEQSNYNRWNNVTELYSSIDTYDLTKGSYYFCVKKRSDYTGSFSFKIGFQSANESFSEQGYGSNNSMATANGISLKTPYHGQIASNDEKDFYQFTLDSTGKLKIDYKAYIVNSDYYIYDVNGQEIEKSTYNHWDSVNKCFTETRYVDLEKGTYYFCVVSCFNETGNYTFTISKSTAGIKLNKGSITLGKGKSATLTATLMPDTNEKVTWESRDKSVATVNSNGVVTGKTPGYTVITAIVGDEIKAECGVYVKPDATKIKKVKPGFTYGKKRFVTLIWKRRSEVTGYQVYYAKSAKGKYKKIRLTSGTSASISLKRMKTYYFKVRAYRATENKKVYSNWSNVKKIYIR